jgi:hypothetical protein
MFRRAKVSSHVCPMLGTFYIGLSGIYVSGKYKIVILFPSSANKAVLILNEDPIRNSFHQRPGYSSPPSQRNADRGDEVAVCPGYQWTVPRWVRYAGTRTRDHLMADAPGTLTPASN